MTGKYIQEASGVSSVDWTKCMVSCNSVALRGKKFSTESGASSSVFGVMKFKVLLKFGVLNDNGQRVTVAGIVASSVPARFLSSASEVSVPQYVDVEGSSP